jgi:DNA-binding beta-propeller fold protein YncE
MTAAADIRVPRFDVQANWEQLPAQYAHKDVTGVAVDSKDRVYLFTRFDSRILVYERDGAFVKAWGEGIFPGAHGLTIGPDDRVYCVDNGDHTVRVFTLDGDLLMTLGVPGKASDTGYVPGKKWVVHACECVLHGGGPFNRCTNLAVAPSGDLYVADGYGNCRVHRFTADGELLQSWGEPGSAPGQFYLPHGIRVDAQGRVLVADRENDRIQVFDPNGRFIAQWTDVQRPSDLAIGRDGLIYVAELWRPKGKRSFVHGEAKEDQPGRVTILDADGRVVARFGASSAERHAPGNFIAPHSITLDSHGDVYVGEVTYSFALRPGWVAPEHAGHQVQKFIRRD